ncbi:cobalt-precorrin 5A hydrolase [Tissierella sp. Yu-01]|uniref:cobalt-precorrin 5A hydrolase n=1 Tax=Tissierella sp. Yu-01 TaxID=3035694 RepID=UPI00240DF630|nr:cobalt-precorrin 5A hydrolase [Tissierella sp. Yu-01]WFA10254.1 cobalt-precorrin 5A hydrolase [Tissierella sp. Yu-01]
MKLACLSFTDKGYVLGEQLANLHSTKYFIEHFSNSRIEGGIRSFINRSWSKYDGFIFISATGIAVRMIASYIKNKAKDPAIIVIDDMAKFVISLLSGHLGGANKVAEWIADEIGVTPVITTASDNRGIDSVDVFAQRNNYHIEDMKSVKEITSMMVNGKRIGIYTEDEKMINYDNIEIIEDLSNLDVTLDGAIIVTSVKDIGEINIPFTILRPKNINIGIGCRKGIETEVIVEAIEAALMGKNISVKSLRTIGTVEVKKFEVGIIKAAEHFGCSLKIFGIDDIEQIENKFQKSQFVKDTIGVYSVSEPCAYLLGGEMITRKSRFNGVTISISKWRKKWQNYM